MFNATPNSYLFTSSKKICKLRSARNYQRKLLCGMRDMREGILKSEMNECVRVDGSHAVSNPERGQCLCLMTDLSISVNPGFHFAMQNKGIGQGKS